jgi:hypothetical protein
LKLQERVAGSDATLARPPQVLGVLEVGFAILLACLVWRYRYPADQIHIVSGYRWQRLGWAKRLYAYLQDPIDKFDHAAASRFLGFFG